MIEIVRVALQRSYTFAVLALLILLIGPLTILRTPIDIFPEFEHLRSRYHVYLQLALAHRRIFVMSFPACVPASFLLLPFPGMNFFPSVDSGQILMHARTQIGTRVEESATSSPTSRRQSGKSFREKKLR